MADEQPDQTGPKRETDDTEEAPGQDAGAETSDDLEGEDEHEEYEEERDDGQSDEDVFPRAAMATADVNAAIIGQLTFHYDARDVSVVLTGADALRVLTMFRNRREGTLGDRLDPYDSDAANAWTVFDLALPLQITWMPGLPTTRPRTAIDPVIAAV